jgi:hypothetical protein
MTVDGLCAADLNKLLGITVKVPTMAGAKQNPWISAKRRAVWVSAMGLSAGVEAFRRDNGGLRVSRTLCVRDYR